MSTDAEKFESAGLVFRGVVERVDNRSRGSANDEMRVYTVRASRVWKGPAAESYRLVTTFDFGSCALEGIEQGQDVVFFARQHPGDPRWRVALCYGTDVASPAVLSRIEGLAGPGTPIGDSGPGASASPGTVPPAASETPAAPSRGGISSVVPVAAAAAVVAGGVALALAGRRGRR